MKTFLVAGATALLFAATAAAQTSTTTTKSKTTTTTNKWQSPDGNRGGSNATTNTNTKSKSVTVGTPRPQPGWGSPQRPAGQSPYAGGWNLAVAKGRPCMLTLYQGFSPEGGGATTSGCASPDLRAVGNWVLQGGHTLTLTKSLVSTVATLRRTGSGRFQGTTASGQPITVWR